MDSFDEILVLSMPLCLLSLFFFFIYIYIYIFNFDYFIRKIKINTWKVVIGGTQSKTKNLYSYVLLLIFCINLLSYYVFYYPILLYLIRPKIKLYCFSIERSIFCDQANFQTWTYFEEGQRKSLLYHFITIAKLA